MTSATAPNQPPPVLRAVYVTDTPEAGRPGSAAALLPPLPMSVLAALGERLAAGIATLQRGEPVPGAQALAELGRLERLGLQLQELAHIVSRAQQLRREPVDLGLALLQTVAEWSGEASRLGVELHGPADSVAAVANPAALKHLLDLIVEHALQQGRTVSLQIERGWPGAPAGRAELGVVCRVSSEPASSTPARETLAGLLLDWLARSLGLHVERERVERGERLVLVLPAAA